MAGIDCGFVQDNVSHSIAGVVRGLHYQVPNPQAKLIQVLSGVIFDVAVDIRQGSPHFGKWVGEVLSGENHSQLFIPAGFAHGFAVLGALAVVAYKCSTPYDAAGDATILWNDLDIAIDWPIAEPILSAKDLSGIKLADVPGERLPRA
jgi:dTDP-4-dehydrorhamnose 3,5-epimerase